MKNRTISLILAVLTVVATLASATLTVSADTGYIDVPEGKWYTEAVVYCSENGFMSGVGDGKFNPDGDFTRAMFVTVLAKIDGINTAVYLGSNFKDVPEGKWFSTAVEWAYQNGYASGTGSGYFGPNNPVTRETLAQFFYTYSLKQGFDVSATADLSVYQDQKNVSSWARTALSWAVASGLISGSSPDTLNPKGKATRAQVALIVMNYINNVYNNGNLMTRNGMRASLGIEIYELPDGENDNASGKAYVTIKKSADSTVDFADVAVTAEVLFKSLSITVDLPLKKVSDDGKYSVGEFVYEMSGSIGVLPIKAGDKLTVNITYKIKEESMTLSYIVQVSDKIIPA